MKFTDSVTKGDLTELKAMNEEYYLYDEQILIII